MIKCHLYNLLINRTKRIVSLLCKKCPQPIPRDKMPHYNGAERHATRLPSCFILYSFYKPHVKAVRICDRIEKYSV
ncbi:hypothetical protein BBEV_0736 [Salisediminibacterium beveridgei]|uniref:Uncharacterized protein n=1 Tax=Salisediminibacterium beveridgei TaxID=632773 RepID=A0A1D7QSZ2_9BACI|nr:hypothetical protein BBEV_0736 [Salisediminibacterium beveridgei]